jgi:CSLREA domain-containing protein
MRSVRFSFARYIPCCTIFLFALTVSCGDSPVPCDADILVTKTADTNDGACTGADCSLREAVIRANVCAGTQTIRVPTGTYTLTRAGIDENAAATGDLDLTDSVTILGIGHPVIDGNTADRIFDIKAGVTATLSGLVIQNGLANYGAGIWSNTATLNINESTIRNNHTTWEGLHGMFPDGGGILSEGNGVLGVYLSEIHGNSADRGGGIAVVTVPGTAQSVTLSHTIVAENTADGSGGGIWLDTGTSATLIRFEAENNSTAGNGSGIYNAGNLEFTEATLEENHGAEHGGGIFNDVGGTFIAREVMLSDNKAETGGGIYNLGMAHFYQSAIVYNTASLNEGGGIYNGAGAGLLLDNTTVGSNLASLGGDGIFNDGGNFRMMFVTLASNASEGIHSTGAGEMTIRNTILTGHAGGNCVGSLPDSIGHNIDSGASCALAEPSDLSSTNPMLDPLPPVGTWSPLYALQAGSPAIDTADPDRCAGVDQHGVIRPQGAGCDRGAHEREPSGGGDSSISGKVWHDLCAVPELGYPATPPPGCSDPDGDGYSTDANGILEPGEPGIPGVTLRLKAGTCAAGTDLMTAVTDASGDYSFAGLAAGTYCVSVDALGDGNDLVLIPGGWTFPASGSAAVQTEIVLTAGEMHPDANFGWDYQFLPAWTEPDSTPTPTPAMISFGKPTVSTETLYFPGPNTRLACGPKEVKFQIGLSSSKGVANVLFFARLKEQSTGKLGAWSDGVSMTPIGNNQYEITLWAENIPEVRAFTEAWLQYQFVSLDAAGQVIIRSEVFWNITLLRCAGKTG